MTQEKIKKKFFLNNLNIAVNLMGVNDCNLQLLEEYFNVTLNAFSNYIDIKGTSKNVELVYIVLTNLENLISKGIQFKKNDIYNISKMAENGSIFNLYKLYKEPLIKNFHNNDVYVKTYGQLKYINSIKNNDITFGIGPAGTGKTYLSVIMAVRALKNKNIDKIILTRPAVEAGENLGFLPGDLKDKVDPYLQPIYDSLYKIYGVEKTDKLIERGIVEVAPLAYMRGRTLDSSFIILDEAQNATSQQMKMFLTRLGFNSKMIVNGDITQIDLPYYKKSGLIQAINILKNIHHISINYFDTNDVVRNPIVADIINAYDKYNNLNDNKKEEG